jgi:hypothetical protein
MGHLPIADAVPELEHRDESIAEIELVYSSVRRCL